MVSNDVIISFWHFRLCGSYDAVSTVQLGDAFLALTGGMAERLDFGQKTLDPRNLFQRIGNAVRSRVWVSCRADVCSLFFVLFFCFSLID